MAELSYCVMSGDVTSCSAMSRCRSEFSDLRRDADFFAESEVVKNMRENPPFFSQWPPLVQVTLPFVIIVVLGALGPLVFGELIDQATIRRAKRRKREKKEP